MFLRIDVIVEAHEVEDAGLGGQLRTDHLPHQGLVLDAVGDDIRNGADLQAVGHGELLELGPARHGPVVVHDLADHRTGPQPRHPAQVHRALGLPGPHERPAGLGAQGEHVAGPGQVIGPRVRCDGRTDGDSPVRGRYAGGDAPLRLDGDREAGAELAGVVPDHGLQVEPVRNAGIEGQAYEPPSVLGHEIDVAGAHELRRHGEVALVLTVFVVHEDDHPALEQFLYRFFYGARRHVDLPLFEESLLCEKVFQAGTLVLVQKIFHVLSQHVEFKVHPITRTFECQGSG